MKNQKEEKSEKKAKNKLPAGTPKQKTTENEEYTIRGTTDPAVPNRAHTEM